MTPAIDPFMIKALVPAFETWRADYRASSEATRARLPSRLDIAYGAQADEHLDLFFPAQTAPKGRPAPIHLFVHGGYWRANTKQDSSFIADAVTAHGAIAAIMDYTLMPQVRMATLVDQVRRAALWLAEHAAEFGGDPLALSASGHSAGGHLASYLIGRAPHETDFPPAPVRSVALISGLYDLAPITGSYLQPELALTPEEVASWSPCDATPRPGSHAGIVVGAFETQPFHDMANRLSARYGQAGVMAPVAALEAEDHMSIVRSLGRPGTPCEARLGEVIAASRA